MYPFVYSDTPLNREYFVFFFFFIDVVVVLHSTLVLTVVRTTKGDILVQHSA